MQDEPSNLLSEESVLKALELARSRAAKAERDRGELDRIIASAREEERLLRRLLDLRRGVGPREEAAPERSTDAPLPSPSKTLSVRGSKPPAVQAVIDELATAARPVHISELMRLLHERNVPIPGAGTQANLITHLTRDARVMRTSRGMYGLAAWGIDGAKPPGRQRRRRKRVRATSPK